MNINEQHSYVKIITRGFNVKENTTFHSHKKNNTILRNKFGKKHEEIFKKLLKDSKVYLNKGKDIPCN